MDIILKGGHVIIIAEWDFERKAWIVIINGRVYFFNE